MREAKHIVIFFHNGIGDCIMTFPTVRALFLAYPHVSLICHCSHLDLYTEFGFHSITTFEKNPSGTALSPILMGVDLFISLSTYHSQEIEELVNKLEPRESVGFYSEFYTYPMSYVPGENMFDTYFRVLSALGHSTFNIESFSYGIKPSGRNNPMAGLKRKRIELLTVHTDTKTEKEWDITCFEELMVRISDNFPEIFIAIIGKPRHFYNIDPGRSIQISPSFPFHISHELLDLSDFFIGIDSCFMHLADINRIPSLGLFGPTNEKQWGFRFSPSARIIRSSNHDVKSITAEEVYNEFCILYDQKKHLRDNVHPADKVHQAVGFE
jgi:ADP-heptose:LPS heptosyltransferase